MLLASAEVYYQRKLCDMYGEAYFREKKLFANGLNKGSPKLKLQSIKWKQTDSLVKKEILGTGISKEGNAGSLLEHERTKCYWFL